MKWRPVYALIKREVLKQLRQKARLLAAIIRPLIWLLVVGAGFDSLVEKGAVYQQYLVPGVLGMTLLFGAMLSALTTVYDKESGVMRMLLLAPLVRGWIVIAKIVSALIVALLQAAILLILLALFGYIYRGMSMSILLLGMIMTAFASACIGMLVAVFSRTLENFASVMNFVIFPLFFLSGSLYPVQYLPPLLQRAVAINPYAYGVDLLKHAWSALPGQGYSADFMVFTDLAVLASFCGIATCVACARFASDSFFERRIRFLAR